MVMSVLVSVLAVSPGNVAVPPLAGTGFSPEVLAATAERVALTMNSKHYDAIGPGEIASMLSADERRRWAACVSAGAVECYAALGAPLKANNLLVGSLTRAGASIVVELKLVGVVDQRLLAASQGQAASLDGLTAAADAAVTALILQFEAAPRPAQPAAPVEQALGLPFWVPVISGLVVMAAGGIVLGTALADLDAVNRARGVTLTSEEAGRLTNLGIAQRNLGIVGLCLGGVSIGVGAIFGRPTSTVALSPAPVTVGAMIGPAGGSVAVRASF